jgi:hypothetical protein
VASLLTSFPIHETWVHSPSTVCARSVRKGVASQRLMFGQFDPILRFYMLTQAEDCVLQNVAHIVHYFDRISFNTENGSGFDGAHRIWQSSTLRQSNLALHFRVDPNKMLTFSRLR